MLKKRVHRRYILGGIWRGLFLFATLAGIAALIFLIGSTLNQVVGLRAVQYEVDPSTLATQLDSLSAQELATIITTNLSGNRPLVLIRDEVLSANVEKFSSRTIGDLLTGKKFPESARFKSVRELTVEEINIILSENLSADKLLSIINRDIVGFKVLESWTFTQSIFYRSEIDAKLSSKYPDAHLEFGSWWNIQFLLRPMASNPVEAGIRTALLGSLWVTALTFIIAFPIALGTAIYRVEYAKSGTVIEIIEGAVRILAGIPSIVFGLFGLTVFVFAFGGITGGRSILSAALTMGMRIMAILIINNQEALRAVPNSMKLASDRLGATKIQTLLRITLPQAFPGILTGLILGISRGIGETAPLIVIGAATFITSDPTGPMSKFTVLPLQIYAWSQRPEGEFLRVAGAAMITIVVVVLLLNLPATIVRQRYRSMHQQ